MSPHDLEVFTVVAEELHFGKAADRLYMAQSAVSQAVRRLEREVGVTLLERTSRRVVLTLAGQALLDDARELLRLTAQARNHARRVASGECGRLRAAVVPSAWWTDVPRILRKLRAEHPLVELDLAEMGTDDQICALQTGRVDVGFLRLETPPRGIRLEPLCSEALVAALPVDHPLAQRDGELFLRDLAQERFVSFPRWLAPEYFDRMVATCLEVGGFSPRTVQECQTDHAQLGMVGIGLGIALVAEGTSTLQPPGVTFRPIADPVVSMSLSIASADPPSNSLVDLVTP